MARGREKLRRAWDRIRREISRRLRYPVTIHPHSRQPVGRVLLSYLEYPLPWGKEDPRLDGHTNLWESREIALIFRDLGYIVDAINWRDQRFLPSTRYDVVIDIFINLQRLAPFLEKSAVKLLHCTGSDPLYQNRAEMARVEALERRRGLFYSPKRQVPYPELFYKSIRVADACSLVGNQHTLSTYPPKLRSKLKPVTISASRLAMVKSRKEFVPAQREFLWFFGGGAVHKGLDLVLEVFARNPHLTLNIVGDLEQEKDFLLIYQRELNELPNIRRHGYVNPNSERFARIVKDAFCFVAPSCSEGISPAVATCLQAGLYPILSRDTGVTLPAGYGTYLESCAIQEIEKAVLTAHNAPEGWLADQIAVIQADAQKRYSREAFRRQMEDFIVAALRARR